MMHDYECNLNRAVQKYRTIFVWHQGLSSMKVTLTRNPAPVRNRIPDDLHSLNFACRLIVYLV